MKGFNDPVMIEFPLRGEWMAPNTPGKRIPSHGTDQLGERYAFDFLQVDWARSGKPFYQASLPQYGQWFSNTSKIQRFKYLANTSKKKFFMGKTKVKNYRNI